MKAWEESENILYQALHLDAGEDAKTNSADPSSSQGFALFERALRSHLLLTLFYCSFIFVILMICLLSMIFSGYALYHLLSIKSELL